MIDLPDRATMRDYQQYVHDLEELHGWLEVDLVHNCFRMGEEVGELFKAVRGSMEADGPAQATAARADVAEELVDVFNYLVAVANRLDIDLEQAFRDKNARNQTRSWS